jgi:hypothetical protein
MKKTLVCLSLVMLTLVATPSNLFAENTATHGKITGKTAIFGLTSLLIWPGIGQYLNDNQSKKIITHAVIGLFPPFRLWSGWDALVARQGGRWDGKI